MLVIELQGIIKKSRFNFKNIEITSTVLKKYFNSSSFLAVNPQFSTQQYNTQLKKSWNKLNDKLRSLYEIKRLVAYDKKENFEYFIFKDSLDGLIGNESKTLNILIITPNKDVGNTITAVQKIIKAKLRKELSFTFLTPSKCKIYAYDHLKKDIHGDNYVIETDIEKNAFMTKPEFTKFSITALLLIVSSFFLLIQWNEIAQQGPKVPDRNASLLLNLPLITNLVAGTGLVILIDFIYFIIKLFTDKNTINIQNIQGVIESFDQSMRMQQAAEAVEEMETELDVEE